MSEVAGKMSIQEGAKYLEKPMMGRGILLGGVPGVEPAEVLILGGGVVGTNAAKVAAGLGANVTIMDINIDRLRYLDDVIARQRAHALQRASCIAETFGHCRSCGWRGLDPRRMSRQSSYRGKMLGIMQHGRGDCVTWPSIRVGCCETIRPTTHEHPTEIIDNIVHYGVTNMPGAVGPQLRLSR
jgi:alanine dehydrogenase